MVLAGLQKCSFVDYPGKLAAVVFTPGCNMNCFYCHNSQLIPETNSSPGVTRAEVLGLLERRRGLLDGLVVSGGEPTLQPGLEELLIDVKAMGFEVKLDTNGQRPEVIRRLLDLGLLDYIAMDIKASRDKYEQVTRSCVDFDAMDDSIDAIMNSGVDYEFRTTFVPQLSAADIMRIAGRIRGARRYALQQYRKPAAGATPEAIFLPDPHPDEYIRSAGKLVAPLVDQLDLRGLGQGTQRSAEPVRLAPRPTPAEPAPAAIQ